MCFSPAKTHKEVLENGKHCLSCTQSKVQIQRKRDSMEYFFCWFWKFQKEWRFKRRFTASGAKCTQNSIRNTLGMMSYSSSLSQICKESPQNCVCPLLCGRTSASGLKLGGWNFARKIQSGFRLLAKRGRPLRPPRLFEAKERSVPWGEGPPEATQLLPKAADCQLFIYQSESVH